MIPQNTATIRRNGHNVGWFYDECWRCTIHLIWPVTPKLLRKYLKCEFNVAARDGRFNGRAIEVGDSHPGVHVIALREWEMSPNWIGVLSHEALHITEQVMQERGSPHNGATDEPWAYFHESVVNRCVEILIQKPKKQKGKTR